MKLCKLGTILVLKLGIGELTFVKSNFLSTFITQNLKTLQVMLPGNSKKKVQTTLFTMIFR